MYVSKTNTETCMIGKFCFHGHTLKVYSFHLTNFKKTSKRNEIYKLSFVYFENCFLWFTLSTKNENIKEVNKNIMDFFKESFYKSIHFKRFLMKKSVMMYYITFSKYVCINNLYFKSCCLLFGKQTYFLYEFQIDLKIDAKMRKNHFFTSFEYILFSICG